MIQNLLELRELGILLLMLGIIYIITKDILAPLIRMFARRRESLVSANSPFAMERRSGFVEIDKSVTRTEDAINKQTQEFRDISLEHSLHHR